MEETNPSPTDAPADTHPQDVPNAWDKELAWHLEAVQRLVNKAKERAYAHKDGTTGSAYAVQYGQVAYEAADRLLFYADQATNRLPHLTQNLVFADDQVRRAKEQREALDASQ